MRRVTLPVAIAISLGLVVLTVAVLYAMGRPLVPKSAPLRFWGPPDSQHLFDAYTFTHMLHAPLYYLLIWLIDRGRLSVAKRLLLCVFIEAGWEIFENTPFIINRYQDGGVAGYTGDSIINSIGDLLAMIAGFGLTAVLPVWATAALFVATEVTLYLTIKSGFLIDLLGLLRGFLNIWRCELSPVIPEAELALEKFGVLQTELPGPTYAGALRKERAAYAKVIEKAGIKVP